MKRVITILFLAVAMLLPCVVTTHAAPPSGSGIMFVTSVENAAEGIVSVDVRAFYDTPASNWNFRLGFDNTVVNLCDPAGNDVTGFESDAFQGAVSIFASGAMATRRSTDATAGWLRPVVGTEDFGGSNAEGQFTALLPFNTLLSAGNKALYGAVDNRLMAPGDLPNPQPYLPIGKIYFRVVNGRRLSDINADTFYPLPRANAASISATGTSIRNVADVITTDNRIETAVIGDILINGQAVPFEPVVGEVLTGSYVNGNAEGHVSYRWLKDGVEIATGANYIPADDDVGDVLTFEVLGSGFYYGTLTLDTLAVKPFGVTVSGAVRFDAAPGNADITLYRDGLEISRNVTETGENGENVGFALGEVEPGVYDLVISRLGRLSSYINNLTVGETDLDIGAALELRSGDIVHDDVVDFEDYVMFLNNYGGVFPAANFHESGTVDFEDYVLFLNNYGETAQVIDMAAAGRSLLYNNGRMQNDRIIQNDTRTQYERDSYDRYLNDRELNDGSLNDGNMQDEYLRDENLRNRSYSNNTVVPYNNQTTQQHDAVAPNNVTTPNDGVLRDVDNTNNTANQNNTTILNNTTSQHNTTTPNNTTNQHNVTTPQNATTPNNMSTSDEGIELK